MQGSDDGRGGITASPAQDLHQANGDGTSPLGTTSGPTTTAVTPTTTAATPTTWETPTRDDHLYGPAAATPPVRRGFRDEWPARLWRTLSFRPTLAFVAAVLFAVVIGVISEWATLRGPTVWTSRTVMLVDEPYGIATSGDEGLLLKLTSVRYKYQGLAATSVIDGPVANSLGLPVAVVEGSTSVVVPPDSLLMDVYAQWSRPAEAQRLSAAVANEIASFVQSEGATYKVPANEQFTISVVDAATPAVASGPSHSKAASVAIAAALAALFVGFVLIQLVRNRGLAP